jgi:peptidyl-prolyl cis-trans isomerase SurA
MRQLREVNHRLPCVAVAMAALVLAGVPVMPSAWAQTSPPGIVVTAPQPGPTPGTTFGSSPFGAPTIPAPQAAPTAPAPPPKAAAKPKPRVAATAPVEGVGKGGSGQSIIMLVNDEPITALDVDQRARLNMLAAGGVGERAQANMKALVQSENTQKRFRAMVEQLVNEHQKTKTRDQIVAMIDQRKSQFAAQLQQEAIASARASVLPNLRKSALEELIEERIKLQEAKRLGVTIEDSQVDDIIKGLAERNKMNPNQFADHMGKMGTDITAMKSRFKATLSWNDVIRRRFASQVSVSQKDIDKFAANLTAGEDEVELQLQRIILPVAGKMDQKGLSERFRDADRVRQTFGGCKTAAATAAKMPGAKFEDMGTRKPSSIVEPLRSHLLSAKDGEMVPPSISDGAIELYAVCGRKVVKADDKRRDEVAQDLRQKEFEIMARGHLRNLKQEAHLECRAPECKK